LNNKYAKFPEKYFNNELSKEALSDFLIRRFNKGIQKFAKQNRGAEGSGSFHTVELSQIIAKRDSVIIDGSNIILRFIFSFPSKVGRGGIFDAQETKNMVDELLKIVDYTFFYEKYPKNYKNLLEEFDSILHDREKIKKEMKKNGWIVFIPNGSILPRRSGIDDMPLQDALPFYSPKELEVEIDLGNKKIKGMALKEGVSVITGGGFHGKSTLLKAIMQGIYAHIPGDGRERIITREDAVIIKSEEGRSIRNVDISSFIRDLPQGKDTTNFTTNNASGSTSQASNIVEMLEAGSKLLLFDEDTCATNFLVRDELIQSVIPSDKEPIKPLYNAARTLWENYGISSILVIGGLGIFLKKADTILLMDEYKCKDITKTVREKIGFEGSENFVLSLPRNRILEKDNFDPSFYNERLKKKISKRIKPLRGDKNKLEYGNEIIDLSAMEQLAEAPQTQAIGYILYELHKMLKEKEYSVRESVDSLYEKIEKEGLDVIKNEYRGTISLPRKYEVIAAINRIRSLKIKN